MASDRWQRALDFMKWRKQSYQVNLQMADGRLWLDDLARFCRANETCVVPGDRDRSLVLEGRREVWLRIQNHLNLTPEQLMVLYAGPEINAEK
jgi:hypothetical protein